MNQPWLIVRTPALPISFRIDRRVPLVLCLLLLGTLAGIVVNIGVGEYPISPTDVVRTVLGLPTGSSDHAFIVNTLRLPRVLVACMAGMALALSGVIMQGLTRNSLASPEITGVSSGASLAAVALIVLWRGAPSHLLPVVACAGGILVATLIYFLAWKGGDSPTRLILIGIGLTSLLGACTSLLITFGHITDVQRALLWLAGSVYGRTWNEVATALPWLLIFTPLALYLARDLNTLHLGEEVARGLGSQVALQRGLLLLTSVAMAATAVVMSGTIGFVGLMAPHIARRLVGPLHEGLMPSAALVGAMLVIYSDLIGRTILAPIEIPCGIITAILGAPFFLYLLFQNQNS